MTTLTFTGSALPVIALGVAWFVTRLLAPHTGAHQLRRTAATPVRSAPEKGPSPLRGGEGPPDDTIADGSDWGDLHARLRDGESVEPLPPTRIPPPVAAHFGHPYTGGMR